MDRSMQADETLTVLFIPNLTCPFGSTLPDVNIERGALQELMAKYIRIRRGEKNRFDLHIIIGKNYT